MAAGVRMSLEVRGLQALAANFVAADQAAQEGLRQAAQRSAERAHADAYTICPVDTSFMRDHIRTRFSATGLVYALGWEATDFSAAGLAFYPPWVTQGHRKIYAGGVPAGWVPARPVLEPAFALEAPRYQAEVGPMLSAALGRLGGR